MDQKELPSPPPTHNIDLLSRSQSCNDVPSLIYMNICTPNKSEDGSVLTNEITQRRQSTESNKTLHLINLSATVQYSERVSLCYRYNANILDNFYRFLQIIKMLAQSTVLASITEDYRYFALLALVNTVVDILINVFNFEQQVRNAKITAMAYEHAAIMVKTKIVKNMSDSEASYWWNTMDLNIKLDKTYLPPFMYLKKRYGIDGAANNYSFSNMNKSEKVT